MKKEKAYQEIILGQSFKDIGVIKKAFYNFAKDKKSLLKKFYRITNPSLYPIEKIKDLRSANHTLDIGVGQGDVLNYFKSFLNSNGIFHGVDLEKNEKLPDFINFKVCNIEEETLPFEDNCIDLVISNFVLEHLNEPFNLFKEAFRVLKKGGMLYLTTENWTSILLPDYCNFYTDPTHKRPYNKESLRKLSAMAGFDVVAVKLIRMWEYIILSPLFPIIKLLKLGKAEFMPYEILGPKVYLLAKKPKLISEEAKPRWQERVF
jgi:SAM-dependent methyltransferase